MLDRIWLIIDKEIKEDLSNLISLDIILIYVLRVNKRIIIKLYNKLQNMSKYYKIKVVLLIFLINRKIKNEDVIK